jgi:hypothetical protein
VCSRASVDQIAAIVRQRKVVALGVDSVQRAMFEARDLRHLVGRVRSCVPRIGHQALQGPEFDAPRHRRRHAISY